MIKEFTDPRLNELLDEIAESMGFTITDRTVYLYGVHKDAKDK